MPAGPCGPEIRTAMPGRRLAPPPCRPTREEGGSTDGLGAGLPLIGAAMPGRRRASPHIALVPGRRRGPHEFLFAVGGLMRDLGDAEAADAKIGEIAVGQAIQFGHGA